MVPKRTKTRDVRSGDKMSSLVSTSDIPSGCNLLPLLRSTESSSSRKTSNEFREVDDILRRDMRRVIIEAPTGGGKSRTCPNVILNYMAQMRSQKPLLVLSSATIDVIGMQEACQYRSMYRIGKGDAV